jgi:phosphoglycolate phosphatase (TIGR01487 family)
MAQGPIRALVTDVDGTLTAKNRLLDMEAVEALRAVEAAGIPVVLASGNVLPVLYSLAYFIGTTGPIVAENGGLVLYRGSTQRLTDPRAAYMAHQAVSSRLGLERLFTDQWRITEVAYPEGEGTFEAVKRAVDEAGFADRVRVERTGFAVHLMAPNHSKFRGVERALSLIEVDPSQALAIGDSDNDISMLAGCGASAALGDATAGLKAAAAFVCSAPGGRGIWQALEYYDVVVRRKAPTAAGGGRARATRAGAPQRPRGPQRRRRGPARTKRKAGRARAKARPR